MNKIQAVIILLMEEILHHLGCLKPYTCCDKQPSFWCTDQTYSTRTTRTWPTLLKHLIGQSPRTASSTGHKHMTIDPYPLTQVLTAMLSIFQSVAQWLSGSLEKQPCTLMLFQSFPGFPFMGPVWSLGGASGCRPT